MEFTNETIDKIFARKEINEDYQRKYYWFSKLLEEEGLQAYSEKMNKRGENLLNCMDVWWWNEYKVNKILDLQKVNRCKNTRFCPNCRAFELSKFIHHFGRIYSENIRDNYYPYLLTLTIPNVRGEELSETITKLYDSFNRFFKAFNQEIGQGKKGYKDRLIYFAGGLRVLEITYNSENNTFHPHLHCLILSEEYDQELFRKQYQGEYSYKRKSYNMYSDLDLHLQKIWYMCYNKIRLSSKEYNNLSDNWFDLYMCDIREMDSHGIYEVLKYTFKDSDLKNYEVFKIIALALENKRIRQGYGLLRGLKCEDVEEGNELNLEDFLEIDKKESPVQQLIPGINTLIKEYNEFKKISRRKNNYEEELNNLE